MRNLEVVKFDSFDDSEILTTASEQPLSSYEKDNAYVKQAVADTGSEPMQLMEMLKKYFPNIYDPNTSLTANMSRIYENLRVKKESGEELTAFEKILFSSLGKATQEIEQTRKEQTKIAIMENLPIILIVLFVIVYLVRK